MANLPILIYSFNYNCQFQTKVGLGTTHMGGLHGNCKECALGFVELYRNLTRVDVIKRYMKSVGILTL